MKIYTWIGRLLSILPSQEPVVSLSEEETNRRIKVGTVIFYDHCLKL